MTTPSIEAVLLSVQNFKPTGFVERLKKRPDSGDLLLMTNLALILISEDGTERERFPLETIMEIKHLSKPGAVRLDIAFRGNINKSFTFEKQNKALVLRELIPILTDIGVGRLSIPLGIPDNLTEIQARLNIQPFPLDRDMPSTGQKDHAPATPVEPESTIPPPPPVPKRSSTPPPPVPEQSPPPPPPVSQPSPPPPVSKAVTAPSLLTEEPPLFEQPAIKETLFNQSFDPVTEAWVIPSDFFKTAAVHTKQAEVKEAQTKTTDTLDWDIDFFEEASNPSSHPIEEPQRSGIQAFGETIHPPSPDLSPPDFSSREAGSTGEIDQTIVPNEPEKKEAEQEAEHIFFTPKILSLDAMTNEELFATNITFSEKEPSEKV